MQGMKGMKGRLVRRLKLISTLNTFKQGLIDHFNPRDTLSTQKSQAPILYENQDHHMNMKEREIDQEGKHSEDEEMDFEFTFVDKEAVNALNLIETSEKSIKENCESVKVYPSATNMEEQCPPGGSHSVILYTTSLRGIRKTYDDCNAIRFLLRSFKVAFDERDVSMHMEFREELWSILGGRVIPPRLFIKGKYIGGADEVVGLHEIGKLKKLLEDIPAVALSNMCCNGCANMRFVVCFNCNGSCKVIRDNREEEEDGIMFTRCPECNENGIVKCSICC